MSDSSSAYIFGQVFELIDDYVPKEKKRKVALQFWKESRQYDFSPGDMEIDKVLVRLGLAKKGLHPDYPEDGPTMLYGPKFDE